MSIEKARETRAALQEAFEQLTQFHEHVFNLSPQEFNRYQLTLELVGELTARFTKQLEQFTVKLDDGRLLLRPQYEAIKKLADNNKVDCKRLLACITIEDAVIVECDFSKSGVTTLEGLEVVWSLKKLDISCQRITSLKGIPTKALEQLDASLCSLTGDLSALEDAHRLQRLVVFMNPGLVSLQGVPTQSLEYLDVSNCGLTGDLLALQQASQLKELRVDGNLSLTSLRGMPTSAIEYLDASKCGLRGDLHDLAGMDRLRELNVFNNVNLTSLKGASLKSLEFLTASCCGLTGDLVGLEDATQLRELRICNNPHLTSLHGLAIAEIKWIEARDCNLTGDHTFLCHAPNLTHLALRNNPLCRIDSAQFKHGLHFSL